MKKKIKDTNDHGIISTIQSPEKRSNKTVDEKSLEKEINEPKGHGIISVVQAPNSANNKEKNKGKGAG
jgi:hypothetical protein